MVYLLDNTVPKEIAGKAQPLFWINGARISATLPAPWEPKGGPFLPGTPLSAFLEAVAAYSIPAMRGQLANAPVYIDSEAISDPEMLAATVQEFHGLCPMTRLAGQLPAVPFIREQFIAEAKALQALEMPQVDNPAGTPTKVGPVGAALAAARPIYEHLNWALLDAYILNVQDSPRDLDYMRAYALLLDRIYPRCKRMWLLWGVYHTSFTPGNVPLPTSMVQQMRTIIGKDDVVLFDFVPARDMPFFNVLTG